LETFVIFVKSLRIQIRGYYLLIPALLVACNTLAEITLPKTISDGMVLQRDRQLKIWGFASSKERIQVAFRGRSWKTTADGAGGWAVWLPPMSAGGPFTMEIKGTNSLIIKDILIGDVWLCSGQSNMVHYLDLHKERYDREIAAANYPEIRQFLVPTSTNLSTPLSDVAGGSWKAATPDNVLRFSVIAYFFAKAIYDKYQVPIGIINASVGGTPIEAWTSESGFQKFPDILDVIDKNRDTAYVNNVNRRARLHAEAVARNRSADLGMDEPVRWYDTSYSAREWRTINIPGYWEDQGVRDLDGVVWYKREIDLPSGCAGLPAKIAMGRIVDADILYVNGRQIGQTTYQYPQRRYEVPDGVLRDGRNVLVIRVINTSGKGGFVPDKPYTLTVAGKSYDLKGYWQYKVGAVYEREDRVESIPLQSQPTALYNAMIAPLTDFALRGFVWYQGESNAGRPGNYEELMRALITDWRLQWKQPEAPFLYVQLPNYMDVNYSPGDSQWALMREAQLNVLDVPHTAMVVAIDLGEWNDIHPGNKKPIGDRLALAARAIAYGERDVVYSGPVYRSHEVEGNRIWINFTGVGTGLISIDGASLTQFEVAGADKKFVWAKAKIEDNKVVVWSDLVSTPMYVRYAWADNPAGANLYNKEGLPATPFRTDQQ
jgi:sialate O-acetylesterase